jgi:GLPGLI family protein
MKKKNITLLAVLLIGYCTASAQQFIDKAVIEFEVRTNVKKTIGGGTWAEMMKENMPQFKTGYFNFTFENNKSIYKFNRWADGPKVAEWMRRDDEGAIYYFDYNTNTMQQHKMIVGSIFPVQDSIPKIEWRLTNENREIAGFNCRKAVGKIMDSVYVFAFYTEEIMISGGPCYINGLPGMILGLTIPRMYTSYIATKVNVNGINSSELAPLTSKKWQNRAELKKTIMEKVNDWYSSDDEDDNVWKNQFLYKVFL